MSKVPDYGHGHGHAHSDATSDDKAVSRRRLDLFTALLLRLSLSGYLNIF